MEDIIAPISKEVLKSELTQERRLRFTNKSHNEIYAKSLICALKTCSTTSSGFT